MAENKKHLGEIRCGTSSQCLGPNSRHPDGGSYTVYKNPPIAIADADFILEKLAPYIDQPTATAKERKVKLTAEEILRLKEPSDQERVSCLMQLHEKHPDWSLNSILSYYAQHNRDRDYDPKRTREIAERYVSKYFDKPNPLQQEKPTVDTKPLNFINSKELMETPKEKGFIIQHIIHKNTVNQLLSPQGGFKSTIAMYLAVAVSNKKLFLEFPTQRSTVAYLDKENNRELLRDRLTKIAKGLGLRRKKFPLFFLLKEGQLDNEDFVAQLKHFIEENKVGLVVFDTLVRFHKGEENSSQDMNKIYQAFIELQRDTGTSILFLHHANKQGDFRGSTDIAAQVDAMYSIHRKDQKSGFFQVKNTKNRWGEINDINGEILFSEDAIRFERREEEAEEEEKNRYEKFQLARAFVLDFARTECFTDNHPFQRADVLTALKAWNIEHKDKALSQRLMDSTLKHLATAKMKILKKGEKRGQYFLNHAENERINKWVAPLNEEKPQKDEGVATTQKEEVA